MTSKPNIITILFILLHLLAGCNKTERVMLITTGTPAEITATTAVIPGSIVDLGEEPIQHGHCYSTSPNVTLSSLKTELGKPARTGAFSSNLTALEPETTYYVRAYIRNSSETVYGDEVPFTTDTEILVPSVTTFDPMGVTTTTISILGEVTGDGNATVTERGFFFGTSEEPQTTGTKIEAGDGLGSYSRTVEELTPGTTYYYVTYAINSAGTGYGEVKQTATVAEPVFPTVTTTVPTDITDNSATVGGDVTDQGDSDVFERGVFYGTSPMPQNTGAKLALGAGAGTFSGTIDALQPSTKYYVIAFASNNQGTGYGEEVDFTTTQEPAPPAGNHRSSH